MKVGCRRVNECKFHDDVRCKVREWFPTMFKARVRVKALDPYGLFKFKNHAEDHLSFQCAKPNCTAKLNIRKVNTDEHGNFWGVYGCIAHKHPPPRDRCDFIFTTLAEAEKFYNMHLKPMYSKLATHTRREYVSFGCRRNGLKKGKKDCASRFSFHQTFPFMNLTPQENHYSLSGNFYHDHKYEPEYQRKKSLRDNMENPNMSVFSKET